MRVRFFVIPAAALGLALSSVMPVSASASATTTSISIPISLTVSVPCAADTVTLTGNLHIVSTVVFDANGGFHLSTLFQPQGVSGTGAPSGDMYRGTGETRTDVQSSGPPPINFTFTNNFKIIGQGPGNNLLIHQNAHVTVNANGTTTATVDNFTFSCM